MIAQKFAEMQSALGETIGTLRGAVEHNAQITSARIETLDSKLQALDRKAIHMIEMNYYLY